MTRSCELGGMTPTDRAEILVNPSREHGAASQEREAGPVLWSGGLDGWVVSSYEAVKTVLSDLSRFTSEGTPVAETLVPDAMLLNDTTQHHAIRAVVHDNMRPAQAYDMFQSLKAQG